MSALQRGGEWAGAGVDCLSRAAGPRIGPAGGWTCYATRPVDCLNMSLSLVLMESHIISIGKGTGNVLLKSMRTLTL